MPRKSAAALSVIQLHPEPKPPTPRKDLDPKTKELFHEIVNSVPPQHFAVSDSPLIELYATALLNARRAQLQIDKHGLVYGEKPSPWTLSWEKAQKNAIALALRLRLSPQSRHDRKSSRLHGPPTSTPEPWLPEGSDSDE